MKKKIVSLLLAAAMLLPALVGCGEKATPAITFRDTVITENEYSYFMSYYKGYFLYSATGNTVDNAQYWSSELVEGVTAGDYLSALILSNVMSTAIYVQLFDEYGLTLTAEEKKTVDDSIEQFIAIEGSKSALNSSLLSYGINESMLRDIMMDQLKSSKVQAALYTDPTVGVPTEADLDKYYKDNYYRAQYIFISNSQEYVLDDNGEIIVNEDEGSYEVRPLTDEEKAQKKALAADLDLRLAAGEDFETLMKEYTMDMGMLHFPDGYYFNTASTYLETDVVNAVVGMQVDEIKSFETASGWYIVKRCELKDGAYKDETYAPYMFADLETQASTIKVQEYIGSFGEEVVINEEVVSAYPLAACTPFKYFSYIGAQ